MDFKDLQFSLNCTWENESDCDLKDLITFGDADDPLEKSSYEGEIEHRIEEEKFVQLKRSEGEDNCSISITLEDPCLKITKVSVVCEARLVEIYGKFGEYIKTEECTLLDDSTDKHFYNIQPDLYPTKEITIKFLGKKHQLWVYGIKLLLRQEAPPSSSYFDYKNVEEILKSSRIPISEKAERAKKFLQSYTNAFSNNSPKADPQVILKMLEAEYMSHLKPVGEASKNMTKYLTNLIPNKLKNENNNENNQNITELKQYVDQSIQQLEERVQKTIKEQFEEFEMKQNQKLDCILQLLKAKR